MHETTTQLILNKPQCSFLRRASTWPLSEHPFAPNIDKTGPYAKRQYFHEVSSLALALKRRNMVWRRMVCWTLAQRPQYLPWLRPGACLQTQTQIPASLGWSWCWNILQCMHLGPFPSFASPFFVMIHSIYSFGIENRDDIVGNYYYYPPGIENDLSL